MTKKSTNRNRWMDYLSIIFLALTVLMIEWYVMIWFNPSHRFNPFPPPDYTIKQPTRTRIVQAVVQPAMLLEQAFPPTWTPTPTPLPTSTRSATSTPWPTNTPTPSPTPDPRRQYTILGMRARHYPGGHVAPQGLFGSNSNFSTYFISYPSEGLRISGMMNVPQGRGPFPVIILCHGYIRADRYSSGNDTWRQANYLAEQGYLTISSDYRSHARSDPGTSFFHIGYTQDILNLIGSLHTISKADPKRVGLWGHSMGGGVALKTSVVSKYVDATVLFGSVSGDEKVNYNFGLGNGPGAVGIAAVGAPQYSWLVYKRMSSINYLDRGGPLSIHHGQSDSIVPYQWSQDLFAEAQEQGVTAELFLYPDAEHTFFYDDWDLAMERTLAFFDKYVKR